MSGKARLLRLSTCLAVLGLLLLPLAAPATAATEVTAAGGPAVRLSSPQAGTGGSVTVSGTGWRAHTLLMLLICGRATPSRGVLGGTNSCANGDGRAVTTDARGAFSRVLPVAEPPVPCPCVVHVATVTGSAAEADAVLDVAGHPVAPLPAADSGGRLAVLSDTRLTGSSGLLTWFGAPPSRSLVFTVGNTGLSAIKDPVFQVGSAHGVFAPQWDDRQWQGTLAPGKKAEVKLPVELSAGAHGDYTVSLKYDGKVLAEQPWGVARPWGVTLFWILLCLVVPAALFRIGMAVVDRMRPHRSGGARHTGSRHTGSGNTGSRHTASRRTGPWRLPRPALRLRLPLPGSRAGADEPPPSTPTLPWFTPDSVPGDPAGRLSAPHTDSPSSPTTPTTKGPT
ncbi:hypothetical protein A6P39_025025 [Streptomyces sp. FXJ1.172]|uniref:hypothetical protein n=1 Tax=Streptomyces sp. FXJ1.172 TaxID=710705 RepID=UPI0007CF6737|nr:hypothetical protein [Streptomyces sp. FXJ1.172]WEO97024.1 hypothetical protein A6P39_025025 [Streptomyces sp. FXJ1.172]